MTGTDTAKRLALPGRQRPLIVASLIGALVLSILWVGYRFTAGTNTEATQTSPKSAVQRVPFKRLVKTVRPKKDSSLRVSVEQIATLEPYYRVDLKARASGWVKYVAADIGSTVKKGDVLIEIDVPESESDVAQKAAGITLRENELKVSQARVKDAVAASSVAAAAVKQRIAELAAAEATKEFRKRRYERFKELAKRGAAVVGVVDEEERDYLASGAAVEAAKAAIERAKADLSEADAKVETANADIDLRRTLIVVAEKEWERAKVVASYGKIVAPFDGVITRRNVDPGSFVQNATTGTSEPLMSVARSDMLTLAAKFPDNVAPFVRNDTAVAIVVDSLPGFSLTGKVSRFAPSIQGSDRTLRVEVDLFNGTKAEFDSVRKGLESKGMMDGAPIAVGGESASKATYRLVPGMTATMRLMLEEGGESFVLPSSAIYSRTGKPYILVVEDSITRQIPIVIQVSDGNAAKVAILAKESAAGEEFLQSLTGQEVVVAARQLELGDGAKVECKLSDW